MQNPNLHLCTAHSDTPGVPDLTAHYLLCPVCGKNRTTPRFDAKQEAAPPKRKLGILESQVWMSDDFDEPLPDAFWLGERE